MTSKSKVTLIPWDHDSAAHRAVLVKQRNECGWDQEKVEKEWRELQAKGDKAIYWIVLRSDDSHMTEEMKLHLRSKEKDELHDTAQSINAIPRRASQQAFIPIGHISIDSVNAEANHLDLDIPSTAVAWIKNFYVSHPVQGQGIGRLAMGAVEGMAIGEPLKARTLMLDTLHRDDKTREIIPWVTNSSNQDWYARQGYQAIRMVQDYYRITDANGKLQGMKTVFMRKDVA